MTYDDIKIGDRVVHCMGHKGVVLAIEGFCVAIVKFVNTTSRVFISDVEKDTGK